jgi:TPP-dependent pyruvate/acetoin dehydrogenase alpha subunit
LFLNKTTILHTMTENLLLSALETNQEAAYISEVLRDYWICCISREASLMARREVLTGKAKFAIIGDGKEVPQVAMARAFRKGDFRSGYYRDQTLMFALGLATLEEFFAQLYADTENDPFSGGRQMNNHFATALIDKETGEWANHRNLYNITSDISSTGGQMARAMGLALASKKYREHPTLSDSTVFSDNGNEVCFVTIGDLGNSQCCWSVASPSCYFSLGRWLRHFCSRRISNHKRKYFCYF